MLISPTVLKRDGNERVKNTMVNRSPLVVLGEDAELDFLSTTLFQWFFGLWMLFCPLILFTILTPLSQLACALFAAMGLVLVAVNSLKPLLRCQLVLDTERQELYLRYRRFFVFTSLMPLGGAEELAGTTWAGELPQAPFTFWWRYVSLIVTRSGKRFRALRSDKLAGPAESDAQRLARELGTLCYPGQDEATLRLVRERGVLRFQHQRMPVSKLDVVALLFWGVFIVPSCGLLIFGGYEVWQKLFGN